MTDHDGHGGRQEVPLSCGTALWQARTDHWKRGIDLSKHNWRGKLPVDFQKVRQAGAEFVILRAGYGRFAHQKDPYFERAARQAAEAGLAVGAYWYSYAVTEQEARQEALLCLQIIRGYRLAMGVWFDQEYEPGILALTNARRTAIVKCFCRTLAQEGWMCGLYCSRDWINRKLDVSKLENTELWVAAYTSGTSPGYTPLPWGIWQRAGGSGRWPGVDGPCDLDVACRDYPAMMRRLGLCGFAREEIPPPALPDTESTLPAGDPNGPLAKLTGLTGRDLAAVAQIILALGGRTGGEASGKDPA